MPLRVVITVDPYIPVPPTLYGGIERIVAFLIRGLVSRGHSVTLFAHPASTVDAELHGYGIAPHLGWRARAGEVVQLSRGLLGVRSRTDVVHSFGRLAALLPLLPDRRLPKIQSYQRDGVPWRSVEIAARLAGSSLLFTGCSSSVYSDRPSGSHSRWRTVFNGVDIARYDLGATVTRDAPLVFLGRLERIKGPHEAIEIARIAQRRLVIAGNRVHDPADAEYFDQYIRPHIDGSRVQYIGPVDDRAKNDLLRRAAALLMPIGWDEPFGIVMAEAFACGTPVIAYRRGSVPEVVRDGVNGYTCANAREAGAAVARLGELSRATVRRDCEERFGDDAIVEQYLSLYNNMIVARRGA